MLFHYYSVLFKSEMIVIQTDGEIDRGTIEWGQRQESNGPRKCNKNIRATCLSSILEKLFFIEHRIRQ